MMSLVLAVALAASAAPPLQPLGEAAHAIEAGRLDQARIMIGNAIKAGAEGAAVDKLLADLAFESGDYHMALSRYEALLASDPDNSRHAERAGISAFRQGEMHRSAALLERATSAHGASWRAWNARGVVADHLGDWNSAETAYTRAAALSPDRPAVLNNMGWSLLLRGKWEQGLELLERAADLDPNSPRIADNLELARAALSSDLPRRRAGESDEEWAARLNDVGVMAVFLGDRPRAIAAFAQAIEARSHWFERAANNLALAEGRR